ncbi:hypothetical protein L4X63_13135 [Geomonas sp. Red32]|uniref:hypothetical protein n=1 Tax=Geomonas sp. Red32 TaxID=2912856 RepID=UPI00202CD08B|nr:hypothetical protein [Geomonas sp. Red32]MCM0082537.1 hypothetical protein [Geomonas sp. Red32]
MGMKGLSTTLLCLLLLPAAAGWAGEIHGRSSTQFQSFNNELTDDRREIELAEYLRFAATGLDKEGKLTVQGYGRVSQDFTNGQGTNGRLYYLYAEYRDFLNKIDTRVGRQFVNYAAGSTIIDGAQIDLKNVGPVAFSVMGGRDVIFGLNGEASSTSNAAFGLAAYLSGFRHTDAEVSWFRKFDHGDCSRDIVGGTIKQYLLSNLKLYGNTRFDLVSETFNEVLGGIKYFPTSSLILTGEYYQSYPQFDTTSIYSVFAVDRYQEYVAKADYTINDRISVNGGYTHEEFGEGGEADVWHAGIGVRPIEPVRLSVEYDQRHGYYGRVGGVIAEIGWDIDKNSLVEGGINWDAYRRDSLTGEEIARRYWLGGRYRLAKNMALSGRIQDDVNIRFESNFSGRVVFDYDF